MILVRDILVRGFDDETHSELSKISDTKGISLNSIVKDAVDKWLKQYSQIPKKHDLILYSRNDSIFHLIRSADRIAKEGGWFRAYCGSNTHPATKLLDKLDWFNGTIMPYNPRRKNVEEYCIQVMNKIAKTAKDDPVCCMDFILGDIAKGSLKRALRIEDAYNKSRLEGLMFCPYQIDTLMETDIVDILELFENHDQIFILKNNEIHKLHVSKENMHKLFMS